MKFDYKNFNYKIIIILIVKLLVIASITIGIYYLLSYRDDKLDFENFANAIRAERDDYIKYNETTMIDKSDTAPTKPLSNSDDKIWTNKTLSQCIENCNSNEKCIGFTRDKMSNDNALATCYPYEKLTKCYTGFKGDDYQRNDALQFDTYFKKSNDPLNIMMQMNMCIGGNNDSMGKNGRSIIIKSISEPDKYIGFNENTSSLTLISHNDSNFNDACIFKIIPGLYGTGTISLNHMKSGKYIYRSLPDSNGIEYLSLSQVDKDKDTIDDTLRCSFYILDAIALYDITQKYDAISIQCVPMKLEIKTQDHKYLTINKNKITAEIASNEQILQQKQSFVIIDHTSFNSLNKPINTNEIINVIDKNTDNTSKIGVIMKGDNVNKKENNIKKENYGDIQQNGNNNIYDDRYVDIMFKIGANLNNETEFADLMNKYYTSDKYINKDLIEDIKLKKKFNEEYENLKSTNKIGALLGKSGLEYESYKNTVNNTMKKLTNVNDDINKKYLDLTSKLDRLKMEDMATDLNFMKQLANIN